MHKDTSKVALCQLIYREKRRSVDTHSDQQRELQCNKEQNEGKPKSLTFNYAAFAGAQIHPFIDIPERQENIIFLMGY